METARRGRVPGRGGVILGGRIDAKALIERRVPDSRLLESLTEASHGRRAVGRLLLGSQAVEVLSHSKIPALIVR